MTLDIARVRKYLADFDFTKLFVEELGWDCYADALDVDVDGQTFTLAPVAHKRGMAVFQVLSAANAGVPDYPLRRKIERKVAQSAHEHLIIFTDAARTIQIWQWVKREAGKPTACRDHPYYRGQPGDALIQKLVNIAFALEDEEALTLVGVVGGARAAFDVERVTKRFYDLFKDEHTAFLKFLKGIPDEGMQRWYVSVMLNRLMFIYFIQKKGFLHNDHDYLRLKLEESRRRGKDRFYQDLLCPLFFEGFAKKESERSAATNKLLGKVPYLNGGIFMQHQIERLYGKTIEVPDKAFEQIFDFFDAYQWHLDERPLRKDNEINPDVLGYIFEKYINQKQMGAYYTKEDITGYISRNTVIPFLFDAARKEHKAAFEGEDSIWRLLQEDPDRYIYPAVKRGVGLELPKEIAAGINDVSKRTDWNRPAAAEFALPTEIWREVVARRQRYQEVRDKLSRGEVKEINDLITLNLDIEQFAQDVIENCETPELLRAFWHAIERVRVLDPTCGSGAFLFAALNILESLYEACLDRMQAFVDELDRAGTKYHPEKFKDFRAILERVEKHPNRKYFVFKSIVINNLYGVDIMEEAVEICKLRLFLKLVAQIDRVQDIEPLPDIDFNIRAGNTLVGFTSLVDVEHAFDGDMIKKLSLPTIKEKAETADRDFQKFREMQTQQGMDAKQFSDAKDNLRTRLRALEDELNGHLAGEYRIKIGDKAGFKRWLESHRPFHWYTEFFGITKDGGFDVIIGNPPYVSSRKLQYSLPPNTPKVFADIYAHVVMRSLRICRRSGRLGMIVPLSITFSEDFEDLRKTMRAAGLSWLSSYDNIPAAVFAGVSQRCTIVLVDKCPSEQMYVTPMYRWCSDYRPFLTSRICYTAISGFNVETCGIPKVACPGQAKVMHGLSERRKQQLSAATARGRLGFSQSARNFVSVFLEPPPCLDEDTLQRGESSKIGYVELADPERAAAALASLSGEVFFWYWLSRGDGFDVTSWIIKDFIACLAGLPKEDLDLLSETGLALHARRYEALAFKKNAGKYVGNFNYRGHFTHTRRSDLLLLAGLGVGREHALDILDFVQRVLSINVRAGEKSIPDAVRRKFPPNRVDEKSEARLFGEIDRVLTKHYGFTDEELDFIINHDIKYRVGLNADEDDEE